MSENCKKVCPFMQAETGRIDKLQNDLNKLEDKTTDKLEVIFKKIEQQLMFSANRLPGWATFALSFLMLCLGSAITIIVKSSGGG